MTIHKPLCALIIAAAVAGSAAQAGFPPGELERIVAPVALYPDLLLSRVLTAATFPEDVPAASTWATAHHRLTGASLAAAMAAGPLPWDISVQALLPFPYVLKDMASDMAWTSDLGGAFLADRRGVLSAVQRMRRRGLTYDVLRECPALVIRDGSSIDIAPADSAYVVVPVYQPLAVFEPPLTGDIDRTVAYCGAGVRMDDWFAAWGWNRTRVPWPIRHGESGGSGGHRGAR